MYNHRSCMHVDKLPFHQYIQICQKCIHQDTKIQPFYGVALAQMLAYVTTSKLNCYFCFVNKYLFVILVFLLIYLISLYRTMYAEWEYVKILPTCLTTMNRAEYVSILKHVDLCVMASWENSKITCI
jgi:hypothetical protein